jgi:hypothetical protein
MTTPSIGDIVLVRCVVVGTGSYIGGGVVLDVKIDSHPNKLEFSVLHGVHTQSTNQQGEEKEMTATTQTYIVRRNGRKLPNKVFATYEKARQWVRKKLRSMREKPGMLAVTGWIDGNDLYYRTPVLEEHGYSISKVEG